MSTDNQPTIRPASENDLSQIVDIYNASIPGRKATADTEQVSVTDRLEWFRNHDPDRRPVWVLEHRGRIAAWISLQSFYGRPAYHETAEVSVYVAPEYNGQGFGTLLLQRVIESCPSLGVTTLLGFVFAHNEPCLRMNKKLGFERWGLLPQVADFDGQKVDLVIDGLKIQA
ncbi:MAG: GNAT family N-acetyltransferase [Verrucomicrobia bacterium]|nr:GNAT family N-acetyltransferase [Verrucomicrobiota bacterium]